MRAILVIFLFFQLTIGHAQQGTNLVTDSVYGSSVNKRKLALIIASESAFYLAGMSYLQFIWYREHERVPFHFYNDNAGYLQIDKFGHAFGAYIESYIGYHWLRSAGVSRKKALIYGAPLGLVLQTPIEIFDGIYEGYGFSIGDMVANAAGSAFLVGNELLFNEQLIKYKFSFWRSPYSKRGHGYLGENFLRSLFLDYNGHTYWLSVPVNVLGLQKKVPDWLCFSVGYSANGMYGEFSNRTYYRGMEIQEAVRYRQLLFSLDIDFTRIKTKNKFLNSVFQSMFFIKMPFPALELNGLGKGRGYWVYW